ncbi:MAG: type II restriction endonuclease [Dehalococcoidia bacterium]
MSDLQGRYQVALKRLAAVEVDPERSNQHELDGVSAMRAMLGSERRTGVPVRWHLLQDDGEHVTEEHRLTWYDSREHHPRRTEWRLYFDGATGAQPGDLLILMQDSAGAFAGVVAPAASSWGAQLLEMFGASALAERGQLVTLDVDSVPDVFVDVARELFETVGWLEEPIPEEPASLLDEARSRFGVLFPSSIELSSFVRDHARIDLADPDEALWGWWQHEERLFLELEKAAVEQRLAEGFRSVDDFFSYSLSVQNRRKARAGRALENHLRALFEMQRVRFSAGPTTEGRRRPDFLFPGIDQYRDPAFPADRLTMLGAKTTCKERWRQVLTEARRLDEKHLCTLEPSISEAQLTEMDEERLTLVVPRSLHETYAPVSRARLLTLTEFLTLVHERDRA